MHGIVTTYQQVASAARALRPLAAGAFVIFDEIHHAGDDRARGSAIRRAFDPAARRLALSGTPFRSDTAAIPFLHYVLDEVRPDFEYGYGEALSDGRVVRPSTFPAPVGTWSGRRRTDRCTPHPFDDPLAAVAANQRLRTALSLEGQWMAAVLGAAHERLVDLRRAHPGAGGLVIATDQDHARGIAAALARHAGVRPVVATSDDAGASALIARFAASDQPWLVAVRMVSEGVDIPRCAWACTRRPRRRSSARRWVDSSVGLPGSPNSAPTFTSPTTVRRTGWPHPQVNAELNRLTGLRRVTEATVEQLERRLAHAERWRRQM
jgi:superfamily II DNA or RNA helicase